MISRWRWTGLKAGYLLLFAVCCFLPALMTGCSPADYRDGSYRAEAADFDQSGWKDYVQLTVSGGKVTEIEYDALNREDGRKKSEDLDYQQQYRDAGLGTDPADYTVRLEDSYLECQKSSSVDSVSGATVSTGRFKQLTAVLEERMQKGETGSVAVAVK